MLEVLLDGLVATEVLEEMVLILREGDGLATLVAGDDRVIVGWRGFGRRIGGGGRRWGRGRGRGRGSAERTEDWARRRRGSNWCIRNRRSRRRDRGRKTRVACADGEGLVCIPLWLEQVWIRNGHLR